MSDLSRPEVNLHLYTDCAPGAGLPRINIHVHTGSSPEASLRAQSLKSGNGFSTPVDEALVRPVSDLGGFICARGRVTHFGSFPDSIRGKLYHSVGEANFAVNLKLASEIPADATLGRIIAGAGVSEDNFVFDSGDGSADVPNALFSDANWLVVWPIFGVVIGDAMAQQFLGIDSSRTECESSGSSGGIVFSRQQCILP